MEPGAKLDERRYPAIDAHRAGRRLSDARDQLQHRALAGSVAPDDAEGLSLRDVERHALQCLEHRVGTQVAQHAARQQRALQRRELLPAPVAAVDLVNVARLDRVHLDLLRKRVAQAVEYEVTDQEHDDRREGDGKQAGELGKWTRSEQHLLVRNRQVRERTAESTDR